MVVTDGLKTPQTKPNQNKTKKKQNKTPQTKQNNKTSVKETGSQSHETEECDILTCWFPHPCRRKDGKTELRDLGWPPFHFWL